MAATAQQSAELLDQEVRGLPSTRFAEVYAYLASRDPRQSGTTFSALVSLSSKPAIGSGWTRPALGCRIPQGRALVEVSMETYEIRVLNDDMTTRSVLEQQFINDASAIRTARMFAEPRPFEVWRGLLCISDILRFKAQPDFSNRTAVQRIARS